MKIIVEVADHEEYDQGPFDFGSWDDGSLDKVISSLIAIREAIPEEYRDAARCHISTRGFGDGCYASITVGYEREETEDEVAHRLALAEAERQRALADQRFQYEQLKRKFEGGE